MNLEPLKVYVETSVWSFAFAEDSPEYRRDTLLFFDACRTGRIAAFISPIVLDEVRNAPPARREAVLDLIESIKPSILRETPEAIRLSQRFLELRAVPLKKPEDAAHVAYAFAARLEVLVSWNFKHIANVRRSVRFNEIALASGIQSPLLIVSPNEVSHGERRGI